MTYEADDGTMYHIRGARMMQEIIKLKDGEFMPYSALYEQCFAALQTADVKGVYVSWMMAIVIKETNGQAYFDSEDAMYRQCLNEMPLLFHAARKDWIQSIALREGKFASKIPRFRYVSRIKDDRFQGEVIHGLPQPLRLALCCKWGIAQKQGLYYLEQFPEEDTWRAWEKYVSNPALQLRVLAEELKTLCFESRGDVEGMFSRYFAEPGSTRINHDGSIANAIHFGLSEALAFRDMQISL